MVKSMRRKSRRKTKSRRKSRKCKYGQLKKPVRNKDTGRMRYCKIKPKKKKSTRRKSKAKRKSRRKSKAKRKSRRKSKVKSRRKSSVGRGIIQQFRIFYKKYSKPKEALLTINVPTNVNTKKLKSLIKSECRKNKINVSNKDIHLILQGKILTENINLYNFIGQGNVPQVLIKPKKSKSRAKSSEKMKDEKYMINVFKAKELLARKKGKDIKDINIFYKGENLRGDRVVEISRQSQVSYDDGDEHKKLSPRVLS